MGFNKLILRGNLSADPEERQAAGTTLCKFNVAVSEKRKGIVETFFLDVNVWGAQAPSCVQCLKKGSSVLVSGRLRQEKWESQTGEPKSKFVLVADDVEFLTPKSKDAPMPLKKEHIKSMDPNTGQALMDFDALPF